MTINKAIAELQRQDNQSKLITLDEAVQMITDWRANKATPNEAIPNHIWQHIFSLSERFSETTICTELGITKNQLRYKRDEHQSLTALPKPPSNFAKIDFCEVKQSPIAQPLYKATKIPATNTLIVEFCRTDGRLMKIHTTTDSFAELMKAFFSEV
ncbi:hypothetical protein FJ364_05290 [Candidatus Dependentiae bacterium]|nr:hypothetical protein [Candidatus Dependentiae bacterium]